jgi:hypothetical protein
MRNFFIVFNFSVLLHYINKRGRESLSGTLDHFGYIGGRRNEA